LWPRGISREKASIDIWLRETAPSSTLRKWFSHDPAKWQQFRKKYLEEITSGREEILKLREYIKKGTVTLLYAAKDNAMNNAVVLRKYLESEEQKGKEG